jgi:hypothetical protein
MIARLRKPSRWASLLAVAMLPPLPVRCLAAILAAHLLAWPTTLVGAERYEREHVVVTYDGISRSYAEAIGRAVAAARQEAVDHYGFDMPATIQIAVNVDPQGQVRLFNDGQDRFNLMVRSEKDLHKPSESGIFHLYGMCHEVGHLAMYRLVRNHSWMTSEAAEGWAQYLGSQLVDAVYAKEGAELWPDRYDYREDGMKRLREQGVKAKGPVAWHKLTKIVGDKGIAPIFRAWDKTTFDPADPAIALGKALQTASAKEETAVWWDASKELFVHKRPKSAVVAHTADATRLAGGSRELAQDDGKPADRSSIAGGGHAVRFESPDGESYLTEVRIHGTRYGRPTPPNEDFQVWLCDKDFKEIAKFSYPYAKFQKGKPRWVVLKTKPTRVPSTFIVCVGFNPTGTKGVFVSRDAEGSGYSLTGLPGGEATPFVQGDWLIRVTIGQKKGDEKDVAK